MATITELIAGDNGLQSRPKVNTNFENVNTELAAIELELDGHDSDIAAIQGDITTIEGDITSIQGSISGISKPNTITVGRVVGYTYYCDGVADQEQINTAAASLTSGGVVFIKGALDYSLSASIELPANVTLAGENMDSVKMTCVGDIVGIKAQGDNVTIQDFTLDADTNANNGIHKETGWNNFRMYRVKVKNAGYNGVQASTGSYHKFIDNVLEDNANANIASLCAGINLDDCDNVEISGNKCTGADNAGKRGAGIYCGNSQYVKATKNDCSLNNYGLDFAACLNCKAHNNDCYNNDTIGIDFSNGGQQNIITNNYCYLNGNDGIRVWASNGAGLNSSYFIITGNSCDSNGRIDAGSAGIRISTDSTGTSVAVRNIIQNNSCIERLGGTTRQAYGILSEQRSDYNFVEHNHCYNNATANVQLIGSNNVSTTNYTT